MMRITTYLLGALILFNCSTEPKELLFSKKIPLTIAPLGLATDQEKLFVSDADKNMLYVLNLEGQVKDSVQGFERPMHIALHEQNVYIPEYGRDSVSIVNAASKAISYLAIKDSLDAPSAIDLKGDKIAIADFYSHRILAFDGKTWSSIGTEGNEKGQLYYPTDVQIDNDKIIVADAYNNRIQVFNWKGESLLVIGEKEEMNATTGVFVDENNIFATDFENNRVIKYTKEGTLVQILTDSLSKPTDIIRLDKEIWIANYKGKSISVFK